MAKFVKRYIHLADESLMQQIQRENAAAFNELYRRYSQRLLLFFFRMLGNDQEIAQDFLQDIFIKIIEQNTHFNPAQSFATWIFKIAHNMCKNEYRRRDVRQRVSGGLPRTFASDFHINDIHSPEVQTDRALFHEALTGALTMLEPIHRDVFLLRFQQQFSIKEIADILNCVEGTVKSRLHYAIHRLAPRLKHFQSLYFEEI